MTFTNTLADKSLVVQLRLGAGYMAVAPGQSVTVSNPAPASEQIHFGPDGLPKQHLERVPAAEVLAIHAEYSRVIDNILWPYAPGEFGPHGANLHKRTMSMFWGLVQGAALKIGTVPRADECWMAAIARALRERNAYLDSLAAHVEGGGLDCSRANLGWGLHEIRPYMAIGERVPDELIHATSRRIGPEQFVGAAGVSFAYRLCNVTSGFSRDVACAMFVELWSRQEEHAGQPATETNP